MQYLKRLTLTPNEFNHIEFEIEGSCFMIKNFGNGETDSPNLYVSLEQETNDDECFMIPSGGYQEVFMNENNRVNNYTKDVYLKSTGEIVVEVQVTRW